MIQKQFARLRMDVLSQKMDEPSDEATENPAAKAPCQVGLVHVHISYSWSKGSKFLEHRRTYSCPSLVPCMVTTFYTRRNVSGGSFNNVLYLLSGN